MALDGALDGGIVLAIQGGGMGPPALHAPTHQNGGTDVLTSHATTAANRFWAGPASGAAAGPTMRAQVLLDTHPYVRTTYIQSYVDGAIAGPGFVWAAPGTSLGIGSETILQYFVVPGVAPASTWSLTGSFGFLKTAPGGVDTLTVLVYKSTGGGPFLATANTFTITGATKDGSDDTNAVSFSSGDAFACRIQGGGAANSLSLTFCLTRTS